jgi:hypothetical protein
MRVRHDRRVGLGGGKAVRPDGVVEIGYAIAPSFRGFGIQFKTGDDSAMREYGLNDLADDIAPGVYEGIAESRGATLLICPKWTALSLLAPFEFDRGQYETALEGLRRAG